MICGIDLAGSEARPTGICILNQVTKFSTLYKDIEILSLIFQFSPCLIAIDAPLSFRGDHFRDCDLELRKEVRILPLTFKGMQSLIERGLRLKSEIPFHIIEVYPHASKKALSITTSDDLKCYGFSCFPSSIHELDAAVAALTGKYFLQGKYKTYGRKDKIIVPLPNRIEDIL